jgi:hypothetical protein
MNTRKFLITVLVVVSLGLAILITNRTAALSQPAPAVVRYSDQVFYSPSIESMVKGERNIEVINQVLYSQTIQGFVYRSRTPISNQIFYSPAIESFIR